MGLDPTSPPMTLLLVMLHTGTMFSVIFYFWADWKHNYFSSAYRAGAFAKQLLLATIMTGIVGLALKELIEKVLLRGAPKAEVEMLFGNLGLISAALAAAGLLILYASARKSKRRDLGLGSRESIWIGLVQGFCLPFRGFSRSGATISVGLILGLAKFKAEEFSFALAVVLTPAVLAMEIYRLLKAQADVPGESLAHLFAPSLLGMALSFIAGLVALKWLSSWLERGHWKWFGIYCLAFSVVVWFLR
jgi:undecaprenyl-diphosphatase